MILPSGTVISHYQIVEQLGAGGMGIIYKAQDLKLERYVALKFLPPRIGLNQDEKQRFIQEAKTTSALDHPNICTIYEIDETKDGQIFISMAYYEGETLKEKIARGPLSVKETIGIARQTGEGLAKAHSSGIIHRDVKPANIMITSEGVVKILDFGIAKLQYKPRLTRPGTIMGTPAYMSPEQATSDNTDQRTDIWALGVIIYEMLTCQLPFQATNEIALLYSIINENPLPLQKYRKNLPHGFQVVIERTLAKDPRERYQEMSELLQDLETFSRPGAELEKTQIVTTMPRQSPSIAVLPFSDLSPGKDQEYFCDGLAEEIISALTRIENLRVVSRNSSFQFKNKQLDVKEIGQRLNVHTVLEGSIRKGGNRLRISIRLINVADGFLIWGEEFEREMADVFAIEDEISQAVVRSLKVKLVGEPEAKLVKRSTDDMEAYNIYLKGRFYWNKRTIDSLNKSIEHFNEAIEMDPNYALAYAGLADAYTVLGIYGAYAPKEVIPKARQAAEKALELDGNLAEAHISLGCIKSIYDWDWQGADREFKRGIGLNPGYAIAHHWYAINYLTPRARFAEAEKEIQEALRLDPISLVINSTVGLVYYFARQYDIAATCYEKTLEMDPNFALANFFLAQTLLQKSMFEESLNQFQQALKTYKDSTNMRATYAMASAMAGNREVAETILRELISSSGKIYVSSYDIACIYTGLGEHDNALSWLERAFDEKSYLLVYLKVDPVLDSLRANARFKHLLENMGLDN